MDSVDHTFKLADFLARLNYDQLPREVIEQAKRSVLNALGCGLGSCHASPATKAIKALLSSNTTTQTNEECTILGHRERTSFDTAVMVNGISITTADYDDTHLRTVIHPSGTPLAALLSWAEMHPMSGKDFILAFVAGLETQCAVGNALGPSHYKDGWHITGTTGHFAAAAAISKAMKLDSAQFAAALGHASTMAGGLRAMFGVDSKTLHMGRGAQNGILAARLAAQGFGSCTRPIESWLKLVSTTVDESRVSALAEAGGKSWQILENTFKPYPCGIVIHPLIDGCLEAHQYFSQDAVAAGGKEPFHMKLASIEAVVNPQCVRLCSVRHPQTQLQTIFSLYHGCAVGLVHGAAGPAEFSDEVAAQDATVRAVRDKINVTTDDKVRDDEAYLTFKYKPAQGAGLAEKSFHVEHATGSVARPMTIEQLEKKFSDQAAPVIGAQKTKAVIESCWKLEDTEDIVHLARLLVP
ncbi:hypothetical protein H2204_011996 [Knufia peltigerae]|uniref:MmgE/PrpD family protein n=1 Tax=Knufia peltigerae TaxID=1002370 RepID=A0AA38XT98_9EURO|nr:hypothetical protein H2204_011996 [Knufia peltigerae]